MSIIRREISPGGKSRAFINDTPVNLTTLKELSNQLVNLHEQHETLDLFSNQFHLDAIDSLAQNHLILSNYQAKYKVFIEYSAKLNELIQNNNEAAKDLDYHLFQLKELKDCNLTEGELEQLEGELALLTNAEEIKRTTMGALANLDQNDGSVNSKLSEIYSALQSISEFQPEVEKLKNRIESNLIDLQDVAAELANIEQNTQFDGQRIDVVNARIDMINQLLSKHNTQTIGDLLATMEEIEKKVNSTTSLADKIEEMENLLEAEKQELYPMAQEISNNRKAQIPEFESSVNDLLSELGMEHAFLRIAHETLEVEEAGEFGIDKVNFLFAPNKGSEYLELKKVASGGELSRLMLCIKSLIAKSTALPTLIFDEIDTGISGEIAKRVGSLIERLSIEHQVFCITHRPQIASKGNHHFHVIKKTIDDKTVTTVMVLAESERILEIAKMLSGENPTHVAVENARELLTGK